MRPGLGLLLPGTIALVGLAVPLFFFGLGSVGLFDPDEPYYAVPAQEMLRSGTWAFTVFHGQPWFDKPILFYWMILAAYHAIGVSETAARIGSALAGLSGVLTVFWVGRRGRLGERGALVAALALSANLEYALLARAAITDMTLSLFVTLGMLAVERYLARGRALAMGMAGAAFGLAALTKGPVGFLLPGIAVALYAALARRSDLFRPRALLAGAVGAILTAVPWYGYMLSAHRGLLLETFIGEGNVGRFVSPEHPSFPLYYAVVLAVGLLPWSGALPAALAAAARPSTWGAERGPGRNAGPLFLLCWFGAVVAIFEVTASKLPTYVLPAFAPAALLIGGYWDRTLPLGAARGPARHALVSAGLGLAVALFSAAAVAVTLRDPDWADARKGAIAFAAVLVLGSAGALLSVLRRSAAALAASHAACAAVAMLIVVMLALPRLERTHSALPMVRDLERAGVAADVAGVVVAKDWYGFDFYLERALPRVPRSDLGRSVAARPGGIWIVHSDQRRTILADPAFVGTTVLAGPAVSAVRLTPAGVGGGR
ncbi:MAG: glycosyltransferase family 39 protein [Acidobacteriia bacterium]|nr:glycosyltransferase family 39 protein [Terriglobia bacterium]